MKRYLEANSQNLFTLAQDALFAAGYQQTEEQTFVKDGKISVLSEALKEANITQVDLQDLSDEALEEAGVEEHRWPLYQNALNSSLLPELNHELAKNLRIEGANTQITLKFEKSIDEIAGTDGADGLNDTLDNLVAQTCGSMEATEISYTCIGANDGNAIVEASFTPAYYDENPYTSLREQIEHHRKEGHPVPLGKEQELSIRDQLLILADITTPSAVNTKEDSGKAEENELLLRITAGIDQGTIDIDDVERLIGVLENYYDQL